MDRDAKLPAPILQPLMENAICHGVERLPAGGVVTLSIAQIRGRLQFTTSNSLPAQRAYQQRSGNKMAQDNIRQRLKLAYGEKSAIELNKTDDRYTVGFSILLEA